MPSTQKKQKTDQASKEAEEKALETFLFGDTDGKLWEKTGREIESDVDEDQAEVNEEEAEDEGEEGGDKDQLFFFDSGPGFIAATDSTPMASDIEDSDHDNDHDHDSQDDSDDASQTEDASKVYGYSQKPAWEDTDDSRLQISLQSMNRLKKLRKSEQEDIVSGTEYERRLRKQFAKIYPRPAWATLPSESRKRKNTDEDSDADYFSDDEKLENEDRIDLLKSTYGILEKRGTHQLLSPRFLDIMRLKNANQMAPCNATITSVAFHPNAQVMLTGSLDKTLKLFQIDGKVNPKIQSIHFKDTPIHSAAFHASGDHIIVTGRRKHYYIYDVQSGAVDKCPGIWGREEKSLEKFSMSPCGRYIAFLGNSGNIILVSFLTKQWLANLKMNGVVESVDWSADGNYIFGIGSEGRVYQFDIGQRQCVKQWTDDGQIKATVMRVSPNENFYATGSGSGVVNVYDHSVLKPETLKPAPIKAVGNLTTEVTGIKFSHDSQLMAIASNRSADQFKIVHLPTCSVYSNWPTSGTPLGHVSSFDFSPNSDYLAIGNTKGRVLLYGLKDYAL
ncbi:WD40-repeat-containing domain protein [Spinellus fusiger]|nr:WD40-repeat-containing domain protein [Spinellus fusiger]